MTKRIHFLTDSTSDIPQAFLQKYPITIVPAYINWGENSIADDSVSLSRMQFYQDLPNLRPHPGTSVMPPAVADEAVDSAFDGADHLFIIAVASRLSAIYNVLRSSAKRLPPERVTLIDSTSVSMGMGFQVIIGAETAAATNDVDAVNAAILRARDHQRVFAALGTLEYLRRGGRINWAAANLGNLLQIKPVLEVHDGEVHNAGRVRTFSRALDMMVNLATAQGPLDRAAILFTSESETVEHLHQRIAPLVSGTVLRVSVTPTIGVHTGPEGVGLATLNAAWRT